MYYDGLMKRVKLNMTYGNLTMTYVCHALIGTETVWFDFHWLTVNAAEFLCLL